MGSPTGRRAKLKQVISASRRTDLVAHYPDQLARRLCALGPDGIHTVVVWTKDPTNLLRHAALQEALSAAGQVFLHWTITGLGGTVLEPNVPPAGDQLRLLEEVVSFLGEARRLHWRYDPLISARPTGSGETAAGNLDLRLFRSLAEPLAEAGVAAVHTSFVTLYPKVVRRLERAGMEVAEVDAPAREAFLAELSGIADELGLELLTCCEPGFPRQCCIDGELLARLHPSGEPCRRERAKDQRPLCGCTVSLDVGHYLPCPNRCLYCYAHPAGS